MQTRTRYGLYLMLAAAVMFVLTAKVKCRDIPAHPPHPTERHFWDALRILPVEVLYYDIVSGVVDWRREDAEEVEVGQFQVTTTTYIRGEIKRGARVIVIYCGDRHGTGDNERIKYLLQVEGMK